MQDCCDSLAGCCVSLFCQLPFLLDDPELKKLVSLDNDLDEIMPMTGQVDALGERG